MQGLDDRSPLFQQAGDDSSVIFCPLTVDIFETVRIHPLSDDVIVLFRLFDSCSLCEKVIGEYDHVFVVAFPCVMVFPSG